MKRIAAALFAIVLTLGIAGTSHSPASAGSAWNSVKTVTVHPNGSAWN